MVSKTSVVRFGILINLIAIIVVVVPIFQIIVSNDKATRVRNALVAQVMDKSGFFWTPKEMPSDFLIEQGRVPSRIREVAEEIIAGEDKRISNFEKSLLVAKHLGGFRRGPPIRSNTVDVYEKMSERHGYCADYTQVYNGIAIALKIPVREWHMAWEAFGIGHAFNEIYDDAQEKWIFIDSFYSFYVVDKDSGIPLSVLEFQERLRDKKRWNEIRAVPIVDGRFRRRSPDEAIKKYAKGADQFFLWWGNNVFTYDNHPIVRIFGSISRSAAQLGTILLGVQPEMHIVRTETNQEHIDELWRIRSTILTYIVLVIVLLGSLMLQLWFYKRRESHEKTP